MANKWNIPDWLEEEVKRRDKRCVYCGVEFTPASVSKKTSASWEHIINEEGRPAEKISLCAVVDVTQAKAGKTLGLAGIGLLQAQGDYSRKRSPNNSKITS